MKDVDAQKLQAACLAALAARAGGELRLFKAELLAVAGSDLRLQLTTDGVMIGLKPSEEEGRAA